MNQKDSYQVSNISKHLIKNKISNNNIHSVNYYVINNL